MPFSAELFPLYISLARTICPFAALRWKKNSPSFAVLSSNLPTIVPPLPVVNFLAQFRLGNIQVPRIVSGRGRPHPLSVLPEECAPDLVADSPGREVRPSLQFVERPLIRFACVAGGAWVGNTGLLG